MTLPVRDKFVLWASGDGGQKDLELSSGRRFHASRRICSRIRESVVHNCEGTYICSVRQVDQVFTWPVFDTLVCCAIAGSGSHGSAGQTGSGIAHLPTFSQRNSPVVKITPWNSGSWSLKIVIEIILPEGGFCKRSACRASLDCKGKIFRHFFVAKSNFGALGKHATAEDVLSSETPWLGANWWQTVLWCLFATFSPKLSKLLLLKGWYIEQCFQHFMHFKLSYSYLVFICFYIQHLSFEIKRQERKKKTFRRRISLEILCCPWSQLLKVEQGGKEVLRGVAQILGQEKLCEGPLSPALVGRVEIWCVNFLSTLLYQDNLAHFSVYRNTCSCSHWVFAVHQCRGGHVALWLNHNWNFGRWDLLCLLICVFFLCCGGTPHAVTLSQFRFVNDERFLCVRVAVGGCAVRPGGARGGPGHFATWTRPSRAQLQLLRRTSGCHRRQEIVLLVCC